MIKRPYSVTFLLLFVFFYTIWNIFRLYASILYWNVMLEYNAYPGPIYHSTFSATWIILGLASIIWIIKKKTWVISVLRILSVLYAGWYWLDRLLFRHTLLSIWIPLLVSMISLALFLFLLHTKKTKNYFLASEK